MFNGTWSDQILSRFLGDNLQAATLWAFVYLGAASFVAALIFGLLGLLR